MRSSGMSIDSGANALPRKNKRVAKRNVEGDISPGLRKHVTQAAKQIRGAPQGRACAQHVISSASSKEMIVPAPSKRPSKPPATARVKRVVKDSSPSSQPSLRFYYSESIRAKTLAVLTTLEKAKDGTKYCGALADVVVKLTDSGMEYYFLRPLKLAKVGFSFSNQPVSACQLRQAYWHPSSVRSSAAWMALNFSRCVAIFGSSWSEARPQLLALSACGLLGRTGKSRRTRRRHRTARTYAGRRSLVHGTRHQDHCRHDCQGRRRATQLEQREGQTPSVQPARNFKERS